MINFYNILLIVLSFIFLSSCTEKIIYSGKIINFDKEIYNNFISKEDLEKNFGIPSYIDPIEKKYFYYTEKKINQNFFKNKISERKLLVFKFNTDEKIISINEYNLNDQNEINLINEKTPDQIIERGLIEKIFGGVGKGPSTTQP